MKIMPPIRTNGRSSKEIVAEAEALLAEGQRSLDGRG
jgi:hypothetical protein